MSERKEGEQDGKVSGKGRVDWRRRGRLTTPRGSLQKVQRYKASVIYFGLPWLVYTPFLSVPR